MVPHLKWTVEKVRVLLSFPKSMWGLDSGKWVLALSQGWRTCTWRPAPYWNSVCLPGAFKDLEQCCDGASFPLTRSHWNSFPWPCCKSSFLGFENIFKNIAQKCTWNTEREMSAWQIVIVLQEEQFSSTLIYLVGKCLVQLLKFSLNSSALNCVSGNHSSLSPALLLLFLARCQRLYHFL